MVSVTEADALKAITRILSKVEKPAARSRILKKVWNNFCIEEISVAAKKGTGKTTKKGMKRKTIRKKTRCLRDIDL